MSPDFTPIASPLGHQFVADLHECTTPLTDTDFLRASALEAAQLGRATVLKEVTHEFAPHGLSCVLVIAESHLAIHTWPEHHYVAIDLFTCDMSVKGQDILEFFKQKFGAQRASLRRIERGTPAGEPQMQEA